MSEEKLKMLIMCVVALVAIYIVIGTSIIPEAARLPVILIVGAILTNLGIIRRR